MEISAGADEEEDHEKECLEFKDAEHLSLEGFQFVCPCPGVSKKGGQFGGALGVVQ